MKNEVMGLRSCVKKIREQIGLTQSQVASANGFLSINGYRLALENPKNPKINLVALRKLAVYFRQYIPNIQTIDLLEEYILDAQSNQDTKEYLEQKTIARKERSQAMVDRNRTKNNKPPFKTPKTRTLKEANK